jgi:hypothetical protein
MDVVTLGAAKADAARKYGAGITTPERYGAKGDLRVVQAGASITQGSTALTCAGAAFTNADVGKTIVVQRAGAGGNVSALTTVSAAAGATTLTLDTYVPRGRYRLGNELILVQSTVGTGPYTSTVSALVGAAPSGSALKSSAQLVTTITSVSGGVATLAASAAFTATNYTIWWGTDDTTAVQACLNEAGNRTRVLGGSYLVPNGVTVSSPMCITGGGGGLIGDGSKSHQIASGLYVTGATAVAMNITAGGCSLSNFGLVYIGSEAQTAGGGLFTVKVHHTNIQGVTVAGFRDNYSYSGCYWTMTGCKSYDWTRYGVMVRNDTTDIDTWDHADFGILNCVISGWSSVADMTSAIRWECGGGLRIVGCKINARGQTGNSSGAVLGRGIDIAVADGTYLTDMMITAVSIANCYDASVFVGQLTVGAASGLSCVTISNCQINANYSHQGSVGRGVVLHGSDSSHWNAVRAVIIANNNFANNYGESVYMDNVSGVQLSTNIHHNCAMGGVTIPLINIDSTGTGSSSARNISLEPQVVSWNEGAVPATVDRVRDTRRTNISSRGLTRHSYEKSISLTTTAKNLWHFDVWTNFASGNAGSFVLELAGNMTGVDPVFVRQERAFTVVKDTNQVILTTIGTDVNAGASNLTVTYATSTVGRVLIAVAVPAGTYTTADIAAKLDIKSPGIKLLREYSLST